MTTETTTTTSNGEKAPEPTTKLRAELRAALEVEIKFAKKSADELGERASVERTRKKGDPKFVDQRMNDAIAEVCEGRAEVWGDVEKRLEKVLALVAAQP
jgi:hypothetical protein